MIICYLEETSTGYSNETTNFETFSKAVKRDYFIGLDDDSDGEYNHANLIVRVGHMKKSTVKRIFLITAITLFVAAGIAAMSIYCTLFIAPEPYPVVGEYNGTAEIGKYLSGEAYAYGRIETGLPAFRDPERALKQAKIDFAEGFAYVQKENHVIFPPCYGTRAAYDVYGWQTYAEDEDLAEQCRMVSYFMGIYAHSYPDPMTGEMAGL